MKPVSINPTSADSAVCALIVLRQTETVRLVFKPLLVNSIHDDRHAVKGTLIYQRKRKAEEWEDVSALPLSRLKGGEGVRLELDTREVYELVTAVNGLYQFHQASGVPKTKVVAIATGDALHEVNPEDVEKILEWALQASNPGLVVEQLERLDVDSLQKLNTLVGLSGLKNALALWEANKENDEEEFWQQGAVAPVPIFSAEFERDSIGERLESLRRSLCTLGQEATFS